MKRKGQLQQSVTKRAERAGARAQRAGSYDVNLTNDIWRLIIGMVPAKQCVQLQLVNTMFYSSTKLLSVRCRDLWLVCRYVCVYININVQLLYITIIIYT
jgi:hypothetical protein